MFSGTWYDLVMTPKPASAGEKYYLKWYWQAVKKPSKNVQINQKVIGSRQDRGLRRAGADVREFIKSHINLLRLHNQRNFCEQINQIGSKKKKKKKGLADGEVKIHSVQKPTYFTVKIAAERKMIRKAPTPHPWDLELGLLHTRPLQLYRSSNAHYPLQH